MTTHLPDSDPAASIKSYGLTPTPHSLSLLLSSLPPTETKAPHYKLTDLPLPNTELAEKVLEYAKQELPIETLHHSLRVFYFGQAILAHAFPTWHTPSFLETYFLTCLLHDIGTTPSKIGSTFLSFEFAGGYLALNLLQELKAPKAQAESVTESIIRHQDIGEVGSVSRLTSLIQLSTLLDNVGENSDLVATETVEEVVKAYPRKGWSGCFATTIRKECELKPWANTTRIEGFAEGVEGNVVMERWDGEGL